MTSRIMFFFLGHPNLHTYIASSMRGGLRVIIAGEHKLSDQSSPDLEFAEPNNSWVSFIGDRNLEMGGRRPKHQLF